MRNIILLCMSTLNERVLNHYHYVNKEGTQYGFYGVSQLEPGTKTIMTALAEKNEEVDKIIILSTEQSNGKAVDFYKQRIKNWMLGEEVNEVGKGDIEARNEKLSTDPDLDSKYTKTKLPGSDNYVNDYFEDLFETINVDNDNYIKDLISSIKKEINKEEENAGVNLYIDTQGGYRSVIPVEINAIVELLSDQNVKICGRYSTKYNKTNLSNSVEEISKKYRNYELITAMSSFKKYGRGDELVKYFERDDNKNTSDFVNLIKKASDAISLCNIIEFDKAIEEINKMNKEKYSDSEIHIVIEDIKNDYEEIINNLDNVKRYIKQIEWCIKKKFIQQALTIYEARIPRVIVNSGILYYATKKNENEINNAAFNVFSDVCNALPSDKRYLCKDADSFFINTILGFNAIGNLNEKDLIVNPNIKKNAEINVFTNKNINIEDIEEIIETYYSVKKMRNKINHSSEDNNTSFDVEKISESCKKILELIESKDNTNAQIPITFDLSKFYTKSKKSKKS